MISNKVLRDNFLSSNMAFYLHHKLAHLPVDVADHRIEELLKYLNIAVYFSGDIPFNKEIDEVWHYWILETEEYQILCKKLNGGIFFHHTSNEFLEFTHKNIKNEKPDLDRVLNILLTYFLNYGPFEKNRIQYWPLAQKLVDEIYDTVDDLNRWLSEVLENDSDISELKN